MSFPVEALGLQADFAFRENLLFFFARLLE